MDSTIYNSLAEIPKKVWNDLASNGSILFNYSFLEVIERAHLNDFKFRYVIVTDDTRTPIALACFYTITTDIAIFAPPSLRHLLITIRKVMPSFFKVNMLECGLPINLHSPPFLSKNSSINKPIVKELILKLINVARRDSLPLIVFRDFEEPDWELQSYFVQSGFHWVPSLSNCYLNVTWKTIDEYLSSMRSNYRYSLLKQVRANRAAGLTHELRDDFADMADILYNQYLTIYQQADECQREILTSAFYREFSTRMGARSKVLLFFQSDKLVGHALLLLDGHLLRAMYFGRTHVRRDGFYHYMLFIIVETCIQMGVPKIEFALTNYEIKLSTGSYLSPIFLAIKSPWPALNFVTGFFYRLFNKVNHPVKKHVFRDV